MISVNLFRFMCNFCRSSICYFTHFLRKHLRHCLFYRKLMVEFDFVEQPSSSSISTTTSSVTSMTSLEHESNDTSVSASDYGADNWDQENWGDMDVIPTPNFSLKILILNSRLIFRLHKIRHLHLVDHHQRLA